MKRARDQKGRFTMQPKPPPIDPELVQALGRGRKAVIWAGETEWVFLRWERERDTREEPCERI